VKAKKWNTLFCKYEPYKLPAGAVVLTKWMDTVVSCAQCGKQIEFGRSYTSLEVHNSLGFGYAVCEECYDAESERKKRDNRK
jgi:hypothetical protein